MSEPITMYFFIYLGKYHIGCSKLFPQETGEARKQGTSFCASFRKVIFVEFDDKLSKSVAQDPDPEEKGGLSQPKEDN